MPADVLVVGCWSSRAGRAGAPCGAGWLCSGRWEAWDGQRTVLRAVPSARSRASDVCQPRSSACATVVLRAINGSAVEEFVLSFSGSISCFWPSRRAAAGGCRTPVPVGLAGSPGSEWSFSSPCPVPAGIFQPSGFIPSQLSLS